MRYFSNETNFETQKNYFREAKEAFHTILQKLSKKGVK